MIPFISATTNSKSNSEFYQTKPTCKLCPRQHHTIRNCPTFLSMMVEERENFIRRHGLCLNCFSKSHRVQHCTSSHNCYTCNRRHNTLLHHNQSSYSSGSHCENNFRRNFQNNRQSSPRSQSDNSSGEHMQYIRQDTGYNSVRASPNSKASNFHSGQQRNFSVQIQDNDKLAILHNVQSNFATSSNNVLLGTAIVQIYHLGKFHPVRALIDSGSEGTFISEKLFKRLNLPSRAISANISGVNNGISMTSNQLCSVTLSSRFNPVLRLQADAYVIPKVTGKLPSSTISAAQFTAIPDLQLADSDFYTRSEIDLLIGSDVVPAIMLSGVQHNICGSLLGQETVFGWILSGPVVQMTSLCTQISGSDEKALDKSFCEKYFMTTKRNCMSSSPFEDSGSHGSTLENSRPSVHAQFLDYKSRSLRIPRNPISRTRSELSAPLLRGFSHHAPVHMKQFPRRFHPSNNPRVRTTDARKSFRFLPSTILPYNFCRLQSTIST